MANYININNVVVIAKVLITLIAIFLASYFYYKGEKVAAKKVIYRLVAEAEREYSNGEGNKKFKAVMSKAYFKLPPVIRSTITQERLEKLIEDGVQRLKKDLEEA